MSERAPDPATGLAPDLPLPGDWPRRHLLGLAAAGQLLMLLCALRHAHVYGGSLAPLLHVLEAIGLGTATAAGGIALARALRQASSVDLAFLLRGGLLLTAIAILAPPFLSNDLWDYLARGRVEALGFDPYTTTAASLATDPAAAPALAPFLERARWTGWVMPYGPLAAVLQRLCAELGSPWLAAYAFKLLCGAAHVATALLVLRTLRLVAGERDARRGFVLWLWNPWLLLESCGSGHNDAFVALLLAAGCLGLAHGRFAAATGGFGFALLVKHGSAPVLPVLLVTAIWRRRLRDLLAGAAVVLAATAVAWLHYWSVPGGLDWILAQNAVARGSLASLADGLVAGAGTAVRALGLLATLAVLALAARRARDAQAFARLSALAMVVFVLSFVPNFAPWYHLWWLPLFALANVPVLARALELLAWTGPFAYLVHAATHAFGPVHETWMFALAGLWPALLVLLDWRSLAGPRPAP